MTLVGLAVAAVALVSRVFTVRLKRKMDLAFTGREPLTPIEFHQRYFSAQGIPAEISTAVRDLLQLDVGMDMSCLSAEDDFTGNLAFLFRTYDMLDVDIVEGLERQFHIKIENGAAARIRTVRDLVMLVHSTLKAKPNG